MSISKVVYSGLVTLTFAAFLAACGGRSNTSAPTVDEEAPAQASGESKLESDDVPSLDNIISSLSPQDQDIVNKLAETIRTYQDNLKGFLEGKEVDYLPQGFIDLFDELREKHPHIGFTGDPSDFGILIDYLQDRDVLFQVIPDIVEGNPDFFLAEIDRTEPKNNMFDNSLETTSVYYKSPIAPFYLDQQADVAYIRGFTSGTFSYYPAEFQYQGADALWKAYEDLPEGFNPRPLQALNLALDDYLENGDIAFFSHLANAMRILEFRDVYQEVKGKGMGIEEFRRITSEQVLHEREIHSDSSVYDQLTFDSSSLDDEINHIGVRAQLRTLASIDPDSGLSGHYVLGVLVDFLTEDNPSIRSIGEEVLPCFANYIIRNQQEFPNMNLSGIDYSNEPSVVPRVMIQTLQLSQGQLAILGERCFDFLYGPGINTPS